MFVRDVNDGSPKAVRATRSVTVINPGSGTEGQNNGGTGSEGSSDWNSSGGESGSSDSGSGAMRTPTRAVLGVSTDPYAEMLAALVAMQEYLKSLK